MRRETLKFECARYDEIILFEHSKRFRRFLKRAKKGFIIVTQFRPHGCKKWITTHEKVVLDCEISAIVELMEK